MQTGAKAAAAIAVLEDMFEAKRPAKVALKAWGRASRYAGARDRAYVSGLVLDALRHKTAISAAMGSNDARALVIGTLGRIWGQKAEDIDAEFEQSEHAPEPLTQEEKTGLQADISDAPDYVQANVPEWLWPHFERTFGKNSLVEAQSLNTRASVDLRLNALKRPATDSLKAVSKIGGQGLDWLSTAARIPAPSADTRSGHVQSLPGFAKGWLEVQDVGSQFVTLCTGIGSGSQVLDYCAGGGGKSLALAQQMQNKGQVFAYDRDGRRLVPIHARLKRAGVRNVQVRDPRDDNPLGDLTGKMDAVFIDAPCTGTGTWRRHPDAKWRLREGQLQVRMSEQDQVLRQAAPFVRSGGMMFYVTCSFLCEENQDRVDAFLSEHDEFERLSVGEVAKAGGLLNEAGQLVLEKCLTAAGDLRMSPHSAQTDGFYMAALRRIK
ncbi:MAG: RsmB/NOP family class I SAM-dependent RNA methyltransferase [Robiginitomaculum sp.]|nr:RsmB/NOP family class I SAM-dependent RNA methyltransferase [Robiginitomaculum sp.]